MGDRRLGDKTGTFEQQVGRLMKCMKYHFQFSTHQLNHYLTVLKIGIPYSVNMTVTLPPAEQSCVQCWCA